MHNKPVIILAANRGYALTSSRTGLIARLVDDGWTVVIATADDDEARSLERSGVQREILNIGRGGLSPLADLRAFVQLFRIVRRWQPAILQNFHSKPLMFGTLAARLAMGRKVTIVNTVTGLGHAFIMGGLSASLAGVGYSLTQKLADRVVFQNGDDFDLFTQRRWVRESQTRLIPGSGVDLARFSQRDAIKRDQPGKQVVVMLGRLLAQKGTKEFVEVARRIHEAGIDADFFWAGEEDPQHPDSVSAAWMNEQGHINFLGRLSDVLPLLERSDVLLFPSYREGIPRAVLEASALGIPTIAFDVPGVRQVVIDGETGLLAPFADVDALTEHTLSLLRDEKRRRHLGQKAREHVVGLFDILEVEQRYLDLYRELVSPIPAGIGPASNPD